MEPFSANEMHLAIREQSLKRFVNTARAQTFNGFLLYIYIFSAENSRNVRCPFMDYHGLFGLNTLSPFAWK